ncbi:MAG TPA: hypothetical protein VFE63_02510 [Roseiarcus sp.]|nr:hypothetical protein [Roseiarcus sp.]
MGQAKTGHRSPWTPDDVNELKGHSQARTPLKVIAKKMKRTEAALRRKAGLLGIRIGHRRNRIWV